MTAVRIHRRFSDLNPVGVLLPVTHVYAICLTKSHVGDSRSSAAREKDQSR
jgi:hypothetical protein